MGVEASPSFLRQFLFLQHRVHNGGRARSPSSSQQRFRFRTERVHLFGAADGRLRKGAGGTPALQGATQIPRQSYSPQQLAAGEGTNALSAKSSTRSRTARTTSPAAVPDRSYDQSGRGYRTSLPRARRDEGVASPVPSDRWIGCCLQPEPMGRVPAVPAAMMLAKSGRRWPTLAEVVWRA